MWLSIYNPFFSWMQNKSHANRYVVVRGGFMRWASQKNRPHVNQGLHRIRFAMFSNCWCFFRIPNIQSPFLSRTTLTQHQTLLLGNERWENNGISFSAMREKHRNFPSLHHYIIFYSAVIRQQSKVCCKIKTEKLIFVAICS